MTIERVRISCPRCRHHLHVRTANLGRKGLCKYCGHKFRADAEAAQRGSHVLEEMQFDSVSHDAGIGTRIGTLEAEFRELMSQLAMQATQHVAVIEELQHTRETLKEIETKERLGPPQEEPSETPPGSTDSLFAWEVRAKNEHTNEARCEEDECANPYAIPDEPLVRLFESPSLDGDSLRGADSQMPAPPADGEWSAELVRLREQVSELQAKVAERTAALEQQRVEYEHETREAREHRIELEGLLVTLDADLQDRTARWESHKEELLANADRRVAEVSEERDGFRHRLFALEAEYAQALVEARRLCDAERHEKRSHEETIQRLTAERDALSRKTRKLRDREQEAEAARQLAEAELKRSLDQWNADWHEHREREAEAKRQEEFSQREKLERWNAERDQLRRERHQLRERLEALEQAARDAAASRERERHDWENERRESEERRQTERSELLAQADRALAEQREQFEHERKSLRAQVDAGRETEEVYQALRREDEALRERLESTRRELEEAAREAEAARYAAEDANARREHAENERLRLEGELQAEMEQRIAERDQLRQELDAVSHSAEERAESLRGEIERLNGERIAIAAEYEDGRSALRQELEEVKQNFESLLANVREHATNELQAQTDEFEQARRELESARQAHESLQQRLDALALERDELSTRLAEAEALRGENERLQRERDALVEEHQHEFSALRQEWEQARHELEERRNPSEDGSMPGDAELAQARHDVDSARQECERLQQRLDEVVRERDELSGRLADTENTTGHSEAGWEAERTAFEEERSRLQRQLDDALRGTGERAEELRAELDGRRQQCETLEHERDELRAQLDEAQAQRSNAEAHAHAILDQLRNTAMKAVEGREEALRQLEQVRQERDRLAARASMSNSGSRSGGEVSPEVVRRLAGVLSRVPQAMNGSAQEKSELVDQIRLLKATLAERSQEKLGAPINRPRIKNATVADSDELRDRLYRWLDQAQRWRQQTVDQMTRLEDEIKAAGEDLADLDRDMALSELVREDDPIFSLAANELARESKGPQTIGPAQS